MYAFSIKKCSSLFVSINIIIINFRLKIRNKKPKNNVSVPLSVVNNYSLNNTITVSWKNLLGRLLGKKTREFYQFVNYYRVAYLLCLKIAERQW